MRIPNSQNAHLGYYFLGLVPPFVAASSYTLSKYAISSSMPAISLMFYRWLFATIVITPFMIKGFCTELPLIRRNIGPIFLMGGSGIAFFNFFGYCALQYTTATNTSIISSLTPVFVLILMRVIYREKLSYIHWISLVLALTGALVIVSQGNMLYEIEGLFHNIGDFFGLASAGSFAIYFLGMKHKPKEISFYPFTYSLFLAGTTTMTPMYLYELLHSENTMIFDIHNLSIIAYLAICVSVVGAISMNMVIIKVGPDIASLLFYFAPVFTSVIAIISLGEKFETFHFVGIGMILIGVNMPIISRIRSTS